MNIDGIKERFKSENVLFATNGDDDADSPLKSSIKTYCDIVSEDNFIVLKSEHGKWYGKSAFLNIFDYAFKHGFDYLVYVDADCFITSHDNLLKLFLDFRKSGCVLAGPPDGGLFCHRNFNRFAINPFLMFVDIRRIVSDFRSPDGRWLFDDGRKDVRSYDDMLRRVGDATKRRNDEVLEAYSKFRNSNGSGFAVPHATLISKRHNDYEFAYGSMQSPWTCSKDMNFEHYYDIFLGMLNGSNEIFYMFGRDYPCAADPSGITSAIYSGKDIADDSNLVCLHTWFTRLSDSKRYGEFGRYHTDRIRSVCEFAKTAVANANSRGGSIDICTCEIDDVRRITKEDFFRNSFYISIDDGRASLFEKVFKSSFSFDGYPFPKRFGGFAASDVDAHRNCTLSHAAIVKTACALELPYVVIFEDDAYPCIGIEDKLSELLQHIPSDSKMVVFGNIFSLPQKPHNGYFSRLTSSMWGSHAYMLFREGYEDWLREFEREPSIMADHFMTRLPNVYISKENLFIQWNSKASMNKWYGYVMDGKSFIEPPNGFPDVCKIVGS